jgi:hypothetical protein
MFVTLMQMLLDLSLDDESGILHHHLSAVVAGIARNPAGRCLVWDWFVENWCGVRKNVSSADFGDILGSIL